MSKDIYNGEHYPDPTAYRAIKNIENERISQMMREIKAVINRYDFELIERIKVRDKQTGKIYK